MSNPIKSVYDRTVGQLVHRLYPKLSFNSPNYLRQTARRLEHLATLGLPLAGRSVLEVGAGIGDHSNFYLDRGCRVTITEVRAENLRYLRRRYPQAEVRRLDIDHPPSTFEGGPWEVIHCYGLLYHLNDPEGALAFMAKHCSGMLLLETCVSFGETEDVNRVAERQGSPTQAFSGTGCRPTRPWVLSRLKEHFAYAYVPATQPNHEQFTLDWRAPEKHTADFVRAVFIASRAPLTSPLLLDTLPAEQRRQG